MATTTKKAEVKAEMGSQEWLNEPVTVRVPRLPAGKGSQTLFVGVNDKNWLIRRGVDVEVPRYVAMVIENSIESDERNAERIEDMEARAEERLRSL